jgi:hypothetical protein
MLLAEKPNAVDHLLRPRARCIEAGGETGVLALQKLDALRRDYSLHSSGLEALESGLGLEGATPKRGELVTEVMDELLELRESRDLRPCAVGHLVLLRVL